MYRLVSTMKSYMPMDQLLNLAQRRIAQHITESSAQLDKEIGRIYNDAVQRGAGTNSRVLFPIEDACIKHITERANAVWNGLRECLDVGAVSSNSDLGKVLKQFVGRYFNEELQSNLEGRVKRQAGRMGMGADNQRFERIGIACLNARERLQADIDLFVIGLANRQSVPPIPHVVHNYSFQQSPIGSFQTGANSVANVHQNVEQRAQSDLIAALNNLKTELAKIDRLIGHDKVEIIEIVDDGATEAAKPKPNQTKLKSYLETVGTAVGGTVSTAANLKPAYEGVKAAAALIGINLP